MFLKRAFEQRSTENVTQQDRRLLEWLGIDSARGNVRGRGALKVETVYTCIKILSETVAKLPLKIYQSDDDDITKGTNHYLYPLLKLQPNPLMSAIDFFKALESNRAMGNAYANIEFDKRSGRAVALWPIDSDSVTVIVDDINLLNTRTKLWYQVNVGGKLVKIPEHEMLHVKGSVTLNGLVGVPTLDYLHSAVENAASAGSFINNFYKNGLQTKGLIQYTGKMEEAEKKIFREQFEKMSSGLKNSHRISMMPFGYQFTPISISMTDAQFLENTELTIRQLAAAFGIKMHQLNDLDRATHSNNEQQQQQFYTDTMLPILTSYEQEFTRKLFLSRELQDGYFVRFNADAILRADFKTRMDALDKAVKGGIYTPNEGRAYENKAPLPGGDRLYVNGNVIPLEEAGNQYKKGGGGTGKGEKTEK
ncbi:MULTISPECIES: phage portal protein [unclassified Paenibacillus]|uniref:phage portal protein n=1 Tax=unclassified Paenibacillus TaxID=185978 RepID=UPI0009A7A441|nr:MULTISPECIES: phage portal protein [unclassified Paenibacillus]SLJ98186.1 phage portal protein, HK97 family [Paenibacillus sp. RU5A]SOC66805.1 phage portal protein, HK97 family [Paenibacillus sp. RU26A]SOC70046.1 phage portal protein, HK97 family [Paenibacillus sp. RU5M]